MLGPRLKATPLIGEQARWHTGFSVVLLIVPAALLTGGGCFGGLRGERDSGPVVEQAVPATPRGARHGWPGGFDRPKRHGLPAAPARAVVA